MSNFSKVSVTRGGQTVTITAPEGKEMTLNESHLANRVLTIGEYGASGVKVAAFLNWDEVRFDAESHGYTLVEEASA